MSVGATPAFFRAAHRNRHWFVGLLLAVVSPAIESTAASSGPPDQLYRVTAGDELEVQIFDEPDLSDHHRVDSSGAIRLSLIGTVSVAGLTLREVEERIEALYVERRILRRPMAAVRVVAYAAREVTVVGQVQNQGAVQFPPESNAMDLVDVIAKSGGFTSRARLRELAIVRVGPSGEEIRTTVDFNALVRSRSASNPERVLVMPGDKILVPPLPR